MSSAIVAQAQSYLSGIPLEVISQGAEAVVFLTTVHPYLSSSMHPSDIQNSSKYIIKYRPPKAYRHEVLDKQLTKSRTAAEARLLSKLYSLEIPAPKLIALDAPHGIIWMEFLGFELANGHISSLKNWLWYLEKRQEDNSTATIALADSVKQVLILVGQAIAKLHLQNIVHGDLTSSNILLEQKMEKLQPTLIDFGLSAYSPLAEDKAVDLYVLERALTSTHPVYSKTYNEWLLQGYEETYCNKPNNKRKYTEVSKRLEDVRLRGRKRSMLG
ncbi:hypothetical protein KL918_000410 [Ogataea parapolymorpha]|uniref:EKC/KEOPS complex subunit BUD32 n=1 Tax=Ogataea parapolymorpha (strain ATCC 26012 / BCRC 20466 / JCM 22074 / NRRL Y-7560 / DL-1) TaxID=871575 RepID=W1Q8S1_OGAPD|nr:Serine/threonine-protein kinase BUD32 [Ogataea parapolymorpha DL-1]ESW96457.1 Serine/threonine-protein kinase BUD32 [Ogataea parapolymorpha DL-1]KAG7870206.1 hypothetical protein KL918_000410 [Ogataea parapolymorpha]KAG7875155.1 hypothetical protein KL916_000767 [Ogataea parapolymorpha]